jgi:beta-phosphoglucomutase-like phosphatase (HAD superfamily)
MLILLDIDGTLVDTNYLHVDSWARAFHTVGLVVPRAAIHRQIGKGGDQFLPLFVHDPETAKRADKLHLEEYGKQSQFGFALPGARELLQLLRAEGHRLWVATSAKREELAQRLEVLGVSDGVIEGVVSSQDVERSKPAPDIFSAAVQRGGPRPPPAKSIFPTMI